MIGFVAAISASVAFMILVALASLVSYTQSLLPSYGLIQVSESKYRYIMENQFVKPTTLEEIVAQIYKLGVADAVTSYQNGCYYGFNLKEDEADRISTFNFITLNAFFQSSIPVASILRELDETKINSCFVDINVNPAKIIGEPLKKEMKGGEHNG